MRRREEEAKDGMGTSSFLPSSLCFFSTPSSRLLFSFSPHHKKVTFIEIKFDIDQSLRGLAYELSRLEGNGDIEKNEYFCFCGNLFVFVVYNVPV